MAPPPTAWSAGRYEAVAARIAGIAEEVVEAAGRRRPLSGAAVLDLACGTGNAARAAVARGARVTGVDITPELMALGAAEPGGDAVRWVTGDASATGLPAASFDAVVSNMGVVFVEPVAQVGEIARLLAPGGVACFSSWVRSDVNPLYDPIVAVLGRPPDAGFSPDQWGEPDTARARLADAFVDVDIRSGALRWAFASHDDAMRFVTEESPMHLGAFDRAGRARGALRDAFDAAMRSHVDASGAVSFLAPYAVISATRAA